MSGTDALFLGLLVLLMIPVVLVDLRERRIPNLVNLLLALAGLAHAVVLAPRWSTLGLVLAQGVVSLLVVGGTAWLTRRISPSAKIGWGDLKFLVASSFWVGLDGMVIVLLLASLANLAVAVIGRYRAGLNLRELRPFGPMLAGGLLIVVTGLFLHAGPMVN